MPDPVVVEEPLQFGEGGRLFGILTLPKMPTRSAQELPIFVFLNAGLLHRVGPARLYVRLIRELARLGIKSFRVDLAGTGDSPRRPGLTYPESVAADFREISAVLESRLGDPRIVLAGLCSGAHNAVRLTAVEPRVVGMVLLDPYCFPDVGFRARAVAFKYLNPARYIAWLKRRFKSLTTPHSREHDSADVLTPDANLPWEQVRAAWGVPNLEQLRLAFQSIGQRGGQVISIFTQGALDYYNNKGQLGQVLGVEGYDQFCTELFWPSVEHTYTLELHRRQLVDVLKTWASGYLASRRDPS